MKEYKLVNFCELDKHAIKSYCAIHNTNESLNLGDITKINEKEIGNFNLMTWGFPCTDISKAGNMVGFKDSNGNNTRSGLYYDGMRILKEKLPNISIIENVSTLLSKKFKNEFETILRDLESAGYNNYFKILCAKDYEIPQSRERVFIVSIRRDVDNGKFKFPEKQELYFMAQDFLEDKVDESYYLSIDSIENNHLLKIGRYLKEEMDDSIPISQATIRGYITCELGG